MNLKSLHIKDKEVSAQKLFKGEVGSTIAIQLLKNGVLKEHITKIPALLLCVSGKVVYQDESGKKINLRSGDYVDIAPNIKHWLDGAADSNLILLK